MSNEASLVGHTLGGRFRVLRSLAAGGMGWIYEAHDEVLRRRVALKVVRPELLHDPLTRARFYREARATAAVTHPALVPLYDLSVEGDPPFLVMALLDGPSLDAVVRREGRLPWARAARLAVDALDALDALHRAGVVHRDLKPSNLVVVGEGHLERCHVIDLGVARLLRGPDDVEPRTATGALVGTPAYMAPEQLAGERVGPLADVYAMGLVLYVSVAGFHPFGARQAAARSLREVAPEVPEALSSLVDRMLSRSLADRPASAAEAADALRALTRTPDVVAPIAPRLPGELSQPGASEVVVARPAPARSPARALTLGGVGAALSLTAYLTTRSATTTPSVAATHAPSITPSVAPSISPSIAPSVTPLAPATQPTADAAAPRHDRDAPRAHAPTPREGPPTPPPSPAPPAATGLEVRVTGADARALGTMTADVARCFHARSDGARHLAGHYRVLVAADGATLDASPTGRDAAPDEDACVTRRLRATSWPATGARHAVYVVAHAR